MTTKARKPRTARPVVTNVVEPPVVAQRRKPRTTARFIRLATKLSDLVASLDDDEVRELTRLSDIIGAFVGTPRTPTAAPELDARDSIQVSAPQAPPCQPPPHTTATAAAAPPPPPPKSTAAVPTITVWDESLGPPPKLSPLPAPPHSPPMMKSVAEIAARWANSAPKPTQQN